MLISDIIRFSIKALSEKKLRALLTIIGVAIGPFALVMIYGVTSGYSNYIVNQIQGLGQNLIVVMPREGYKLTENDLNVLSGIDHVVDTSPFYSLQGVAQLPTGEMDILIYGVKYSFLFKAIPSLKVGEGEIPAETDIVKCVIGYDIAYDENGNQRIRVGDAITIMTFRVVEAGKIETRRAVFIVAAILEKYGGAAILNPDITVFVSSGAAEKFLQVREWSGILLLAEDPIYVDSITNKIRELYDGSVSVTSFYAIAQIASSISGAVNFMTFAASLAAFAVAVAGVAATMITSVIERTREIGVLKALGFTDGQVLLLILAEGLLISIIGGLIGITGGVVGAYVLASNGLTIRAGTTEIVVRAPPNLSIFLIAITIVLTIMIGILGSVFPAYRAAKIPPAVALRYE